MADLASLKEQILVGQKQNEELRRRNEELQAELESAQQDMESMQWQNARQIQDLQEKNKRLSEGKDKMWSELSNVKQQMQLLCDMLECSSVMGLYSAVQQCQTGMFEAQEESDYLKKELQSKTLAAEAQQTHLTELQAQLLRQRQEYEYKLEKEKRKFYDDREKWGEKEYALIEAIQNQSRKLVKRTSNKINHSSDASNSTDSGSSLVERPSKFQNQSSPYIAPSPYNSGPSPPISPLPLHMNQIHPSPSYSPYHPPQSPSLSRPQTPQSGAYRPLFGQFSQSRNSFRGGYESSNNVLQDGTVQSTLEAQGSSSDPVLSRAAERVRKLQHNASVFGRN